MYLKYLMGTVQNRDKQLDCICCTISSKCEYYFELLLQNKKTISYVIEPLAIFQIYTFMFNIDYNSINYQELEHTPF